MRNDLKQLVYLEKQYPGVIKLIRYEDYIRYPNQTLLEIYNHFDEPSVPEAVTDAIHNYIYARRNGGKYDQHRENGSKAIENWISKYDEDTIRAMNRECKDVLQSLAYDLIYHDEE